jgi:PEP-CTERM motif
MWTLKTMCRACVIVGIPAAALALSATPAIATSLPDGTFIGGCTTNLTSPNAAGCNGYYSGNILNGSSTDIANQQAAITSLTGGSFNWNGDWNGLVNAGDVITSLVNGNQISFNQALLGQTVIGAHFGNIAGDAGNVSVFWLFNFNTPTTSITLNNTQGFSNAALYTTTPAVPEPATWAMMILGFAGIGFAMRRRGSPRALLAQIA